MLPVFSLGIWPSILLGLLLTQLIIALVTVYFHRAVSHRALKLSHGTHRVCRFLAWFLIGMVPREFAAVHRKHHAKCDTPDDPHSPVHFGWRRVLFGGLALYRREAADPQTLQQYGAGMEPDPLEPFYLKHRNLGILSFGALMLVLFGWVGLGVWALCMVWIPFWAAGVINGLGHHVGYRNFSTDDHSTNLIPWGVWVGGEELHNNHHADPSGAKFSKRWYEFDLGWGWIRLLCALGLAKVRPTSTPASGFAKLLQRRYEWLDEFHASLAHDFAEPLALRGYKHWKQLSAQLDELGKASSARARQALESCPQLRRAHELERELRQLWQVRRTEARQATEDFEAWVHKAREQGGQAVQAFCDRLTFAPSASHT